jgi:hypothetical protein
MKRLASRERTAEVASDTQLLFVFGVYRRGRPASQTFQKKRLGISRVYNAWRLLACWVPRVSVTYTPLAWRHCYISGHANHRFPPDPTVRHSRREWQLRVIRYRSDRRQYSHTTGMGLEADVIQ